MQPKWSVFPCLPPPRPRSLARPLSPASPVPSALPCTVSPSPLPPPPPPPFPLHQELVALGLCNLVGSFFSAYPASASLSRSALVSSLTGPSCTPMHGLWQSAVVLLVLTLLTPAFQWLPYSALAAIVLCAVASLFDPCRVRAIWAISRPDAGLWTLAFLSTLALGIQLGIAISVGGSMLVIVLHSMRPHHAVLGRVPGTAVYRSRRLYPEARAPNRSLIFRWDASIHFANADHFRDSLMGHIKSYSTQAQTPTGRAAPPPPLSLDSPLARASGASNTEGGPPLHVVILEFAGVNNVDTTALRMLCDLARELQQRGITTIVSSCKSQASFAPPYVGHPFPTAPGPLLCDLARELPQRRIVRRLFRVVNCRWVARPPPPPNNAPTPSLLRMLCDLAGELQQRGMTTIVSSCKSQAGVAPPPLSPPPFHSRY
jgi:MFS superfamily sulfate permease-like transporter